MFALTVGLLIVRLLDADAKARLDQLLTTWQKTQESVQSLVIDFTVEEKDLTFDTCKKSAGSLGLIRTDKGEVFASFDVTPTTGNGPPEAHFSGLLHNRHVYLLNHDLKRGYRFELGVGDLPDFLAVNFNPFVLLVDQKRLFETYDIKLIRLNEHYTSLLLQPKYVKRKVWFSGSEFKLGQVVIMNQASLAIPEDMPRRFWYQTPNGTQYTFAIKRWLLNCSEMPQRGDFVLPENRPGWVVTGGPFPQEKKEQLLIRRRVRAAPAAQ